MTGAYEFICKESSTDKLCVRLNALGGWHWYMGDSYWYGDYVGSKPFPGVRIRIIDFPTPIEGEYKYDADTHAWKRLRSEEHTSELQSHSDLVCRLLLEKKKKKSNVIMISDIVVSEA